MYTQKRGGGGWGGEGVRGVRGGSESSAYYTFIGLYIIIIIHKFSINYTFKAMFIQQLDAVLSQLTGC